MKKIIAFALLLAILLTLMPASVLAEKTITANSVLALFGGLIPIEDIIVKGGDPYPVAITIYLDHEKALLSKFGSYCYFINELLKITYGENFDLTVTQSVSGGQRAYYTFTNTGTGYGELINYKQTNFPHHYENMTLEQFRKMFPAMVIDRCY